MINPALSHRIKSNCSYRRSISDIKDWLQFWSLFKRIHGDEDIEADEKFQYLLQAITRNSKPRQLIECYTPTGENYSKAIGSLRSRFGREDLLIEYYVRELLKLVLPNLANKTNLASLYDEMDAQLRALDTLGVTTDTCSAMLYPLLESSRPE
ncbi:unnamed protein product [Phaedon cochleariae]|uniref:Uncharacterized protein n=1 Tax=Phaedon cochleariae TaxID=80249 RepID=A0A9N9SLB2_PHACE|nr:unnamed protein product [Phaedon cochleariae]